MGNRSDGLPTMARAANVDYFCVPNARDEIALREAGVDAPIMVLYLTEASYAPVLLHYDLEPAAYIASRG